MASTYHTDIQKLYVAYFNRPADVDGLNYWEGVVEAAKGDTAAISAAFAGSLEYKAAFANMGPSAVVTQVYKNLFGTSPDLAGLNFWATKLANGTLSVDTIVKNIADGAQGADKTAYANKVTAATAFTNALDTAAEINAYAKPAASAPAKAFISSISTDASLAAAMVPSTMAATVASVTQAGNAGSAFSMTLGMDALVGTEGNDTFTARIFNNDNTLQSGDTIVGGAGAADRLNADIGNSQRFAITPETTGVEVVAIRAQAVSTDSTDNNTAATNEVQIDAQRMVGVNQWESNNSRADLLIEDVRILDSQITRDITIAMVETDPGHSDFGVYFDQYSLRSQTNSTNVLRLQLMDTRSAAEGKAPLLESPYNGFAFFYNGVLTVVQDPAIDAAKTYPELLIAITNAVAKAGLTNIAVTAGSTFTVLDSLGSAQTGTEILLTSTNGDTINATGTGAGWLAAGAVPPSSGLHTNMSTVAASSVELVTSKVILDDVGRGSMGGDLVIGGLSVGDTSTSLGVQRFEIEVRDNSKLQTVSSTNNSLREVTMVNGITTSTSNAYVTNTKDKGDLTITGADQRVAPNSINVALPGSAAQHNGFGLTDVRLIDASAMTGKLNVTAAVTTASIAKYINLKDNAVNAAADNIAFNYTGGANDDTITVAIDGAVAASQSLLMVGREDFTFTTNGGAGNDTITVAMVNGALGGNTSAWYANQAMNANVTINGGDGNDTIWTPGSGNAIINAGTGDDVVYTDNTGSLAIAAAVNGGRATFVFNAADGDAVAAGTQYNFGDLRSQAAASVSAVNAQLTVNFLGLTKTVTIANSMNSLTNVTITDLHVNQAIKDAINNDAVLNKLLVAEDGPARTLIVRSLIDGELVTGDLAVSFSSTPLNTSQAALTGTAAVTLFGAANTGYAGFADGYATNFAQYNNVGAVPVTGVTAVAEVQTMDFAAESVAPGQNLTLNIGGVPVVYNNVTGGAVAGAALATAVAGLAVTNYTLGAGAPGSTTVTFTQNAGFESNIAPITAVNQTPDGAAPVSTTVTDGVAGVTAVIGSSLATGANSTATSDNTVTLGAGNDVLVLGSDSIGAGVDSSNDTVVYTAGAFGADTIVYFEATGAGVDKLDFTALGGVGTVTAAGGGVSGGVTAANRSITIVAETTANDTIAEIVALYAGTDSATAITHVYVAYDANNVAKVYTIADAAGTAAGNITATLVGTIDLADTGWATLTGANFI